MYRKTVNYTDLNGEKRTEDLYFNLKTTELISIRGIMGADPTTKIRSMINDNDIGGMLEVVDKFVSFAYGRKSDDGKRFIKNATETEEFRQSEAYEALMMEFINNPEELTKFINGCIPAELAAQIAMHPELTAQITK